MESRVSMLALIKLGGSIVTFKDKPLAFNAPALEGVSRILKRISDEVQIIVVHGGGSFGHYYSVIYDMHSKPAEYSKEGVSRVRCSMVDLNNRIVNVMLEQGLRPYTIHPSSFIGEGKVPISSRVEELYDISKDGLIPVTHGDVMHYQDNLYYILSGDEIMSILAEHLGERVSVVLFTLAVDGVYKDMQSRELIRELRYASDASMDDVSMDVTGGMRRKVREGFKIASLGIDVWFVNGMHPERVEDVLRGKDTIGTVIRGNRVGREGSEMVA
ncbi:MULTISPECIES: isopentenyl phosphate kinase [Candidatus Nitrosocaldus]|uniref:Isopentenyl phosphate kinase n=1 Tax=Candidatus Nitrosocaldus cavascurensis TaxID=2058097 RepID=A0A2K5ASR3_9ARCH|nr:MULTISPECIES: isopentenyl phosphate kinase [Candidatus Nitrosocaldus]SPC34683.1 putative isopentenyl phosphate kinase [Candidatus Nitrosocaldus cavascurensis]